MALNFRYSEVSRAARAVGERYLEVTRGYEDLVVPRGLGVMPLAVLGMVARARQLLRAAYGVADTGDALAADVLLRTVTESVLTLAWLDHDPELGALVWTLDEVRTRLEHHEEVAKEERRDRARARRRGEAVEPLPSGRSLGLMPRARVRELRQIRVIAIEQVEGLARLSRRRQRLRISDIERMPGFRARARVADMPWVYSLAYRYASNAAAHPTGLAVEQFLELQGDSIVVLASARGGSPEPYYVGAQLMSALLELAGRHVDQTELEPKLNELRIELDRLRAIVVEDLP